MRQDRATFQKTSVAGLHILKCLFYMVDNIHLTTLTQHVMVGITRSKVIEFFFCFDHFDLDFEVPHLCDLWSCGVILFALVCGYLPFEDGAL